MDALDSRCLSDLVCVVTRYFGGTKLGTGGLARAYNQCARETLSRGKPLPVHPVVVFHITFPYELTGKVHSVIAHFNGRIRQTLYGTGADLVVELRKSLAPDFRRRMTDISSGQATLRQENDHAG